MKHKNYHIDTIFWHFVYRLFAYQSYVERHVTLWTTYSYLSDFVKNTKGILFF